MNNKIDIKMKIDRVEERPCSTSGLMLIITLIGMLGNYNQKVWDTLILEHDEILPCRIGRSRAKELSVACGFSKRPKDSSLLEGHEVMVRLALDDDGDWRVLKYMSCTEKPQESDDFKF